MCKTIEYDDYLFHTNDHQQMLQEIRMMDEKTSWISIKKAKDIKVHAFQQMDINSALSCGADAYVDQPVLVALTMLDHKEPLNLKNVRIQELTQKVKTSSDPQGLKDQIGKLEQELTYWMDLATDTTIGSSDGPGTCMLIQHEDKSCLLRPCALSSLYARARISGAALGCLMRDKRHEELAMILNTCLSEADNGATLCVRAGKCAAVLSDQYVVMDTYDVVRTAEEELKNRFGALEFVEGFNEHFYTYLRYILPDMQSVFMDKYRAALQHNFSNYRGMNLIPAVSVSNSDTGLCAATVQPLFTRPGENSYIRFTKPLKVEHIGKQSSLEEFRKVVRMVYAQFEDTAKTIAKMTNTVMDFPIEAISRMGKAIGLPKKYITNTENVHRVFGAGSCSMYDLYLSFYDALADVDVLKARLDLEETVARLLTLDWKSFDYPEAQDESKAKAQVA